jgi:hypothetical protein
MRGSPRTESGRYSTPLPGRPSGDPAAMDGTQAAAFVSQKILSISAM